MVCQMREIPLDMVVGFYPEAPLEFRLAKVPDDASHGYWLTITNTELRDRIDQCRAACLAILHRTRRWTLTRDVRRLLARMLWQSRRHEAWDARAEIEGRKLKV